MRKKEIKEKFEILNEQIKSLAKRHEDLYKVTQFILKAIGKYTDEPIYRVIEIYHPYDCYNHGCVTEYVLQYAYNTKVKEIKTLENIQSTELFAYCDTHFILKNHNNKYFLVDMKNGVITNVPTQFLCSEEMNLIIEGQILKVCHGSGTIGVRHE
jgi:hypothetical protein